MLVIYVGDSKTVYKRIRTNHCNGNVEASALRRYVAEAMGFKIKRQRRASGSVRVRLDLTDPQQGESKISKYICQGKWKILLLDDYVITHDFQWYLIENLKPLLNRECQQYQTANSELYDDLSKRLIDSQFITCSLINRDYSSLGVYILYHQRKPSNEDEISSFNNHKY